MFMALGMVLFTILPTFAVWFLRYFKIWKIEGNIPAVRFCMHIGLLFNLQDFSGFDAVNPQKGFCQTRNCPWGQRLVEGACNICLENTFPRHMPSGPNFLESSLTPVIVFRKSFQNYKSLPCGMLNCTLVKVFSLQVRNYHRSSGHDSVNLHLHTII